MFGTSLARRSGMVRNCPICGKGSVSEGISLGGYSIVRCADCDFRFAPDAYSADFSYDDVYESPEYISTQIQAIQSVKDPRTFSEIGTYKPFFKAVQNIRGRCNKLLDVGCGVGRFLHAARAAGWCVEGIDSSERAISVGQMAATFPMTMGTIESVAHSGKQYDVVTMFEVLEHVSDPVSQLRQAAHVILSNGSLFCTVPNWDCALVRCSSNPAWLPPIHLNFFTKRSLRALAEKAGFEVVATGFVSTTRFPMFFCLYWPFYVLNWVAKRFLYSTDKLGIWIHARPCSC